MPQGSDKQKESHLISVLRSYALESANPANALDKINAMIQNNASQLDYVLALADGLRFGNWPWTERHTTRSLMNIPTHFIHCPAYAGNEYECNCIPGIK